MTQEPTLVDLDAANFEALPCCGVKNPEHEGRRLKNCWVREYLAKGLRARVLLTPDNRQCGYIEYLPGEYAWRAVDARGYLFIHCLWTFYKQYQHKGLARRMVEACVEDARKAGLHGVAVLARDNPWLARPALFRKCGFEVVEEAAPDYQLLALKLDPAAPNPAFRKGFDRKLKKYGQGLTMIRSNQCPHIAKFAGEIAQTAEKEYGIQPRIVELETHRDAQSAPTPYAVFALIYDGRLLADHQISRTRFRNIMRSATRPDSARRARSPR